MARRKRIRWEGMDGLSIEGQGRMWKKARKELERITEIPYKELKGCFVLIKERGNNYFGKIGKLERYDLGLIEGKETFKVKFYTKGKTRPRKVEFTYSTDEGYDIEEDKVFWSPNIIMLLEEHDNLWKLFSD